jgi:hypothetical protein
LAAACRLMQPEAAAGHAGWDAVRAGCCCRRARERHHMLLPVHKRRGPPLARAGLETSRCAEASSGVVRAMLRWPWVPCLAQADPSGWVLAAACQPSRRACLPSRRTPDATACCPSCRRCCTWGLWRCCAGAGCPPLLPHSRKQLALPAAPQHWRRVLRQHCPMLSSCR